MNTRHAQAPRPGEITLPFGVASWGTYSFDPWRGRHPIRTPEATGSLWLVYPDHERIRWSSTTLDGKRTTTVTDIPTIGTMTGEDMEFVEEMWGKVFKTDVRSDSHPDELIESARFAFAVEPGWHVATPLTSQGLALLTLVKRTGIESDDAAEESEVDTLRCGFAHPSPEYAREVARQLADGDRDAFAWNVTYRSFDPYPVGTVVLWTKDDDGTVREIERLDPPPPKPPVMPARDADA